MVHNDNAYTMLGLGGVAALFERSGDQLVIQAELNTGGNQTMTGAGLSDAWWVVAASANNDAALHVTSRETGESIGSFSLPARASFSDYDPTPILAVRDGLIFFTHYDADGEYILIVGADDNAPNGFSEVTRISVPARAVRLDIDDESGDFSVLTEAGVGQLTPICLGAPRDI